MQPLGHPQPVKPPPALGWLVALRVLLVILSIGSIGLLAWIPLLRLALLTRRAIDWCVMAASIVVEFLGVLLLGTDETENTTTVAGNLGVVLILFVMMGSATYYLIVEIRNYQRIRAGAFTGPQPAYGWAPSPYGPTTIAPTAGPTVPYGSRPPMAQGPMQLSPPPGPFAPAPGQTPPPVPAHPSVPSQPPVPPPASPRIEQVRAELDELSDYLRNQNRDGRDTYGDSR